MIFSKASSAATISIFFIGKESEEWVYVFGPIFLGAKELPQRDGLTELYNDRHIHYRLRSEIQRADRRQLSLSPLFLDHFKEINDRYGHLEGDQAQSETIQARVIADNPHYRISTTPLMADQTSFDVDPRFTIFGVALLEEHVPQQKSYSEREYGLTRRPTRPFVSRGDEE